MRHRLLSPAWLLKHAFALTIFVTMLGLGFWQLDRLADRRSANAARQALLDQPAATLTGQEADATALVGRKVRLTGIFLNDESVVLRARRSDSGVDGVHLLTPLHLSGSDRAILVDRGWLPINQRESARLAAYAIPREITLEGLAWPPQVRPDSPLAPRDLPLPGETRIPAWVRVDVAALQAQVSVPLLPLYVEALPTGNNATLPRPSDPRQLDDGPHLGYAAQWFGFAAMLAIVYAALMRQELQATKP
ncbi:MAG: SURF1 family protein [Oscillochloridaceae bacterium umkhey_bin13]